MPHRTDASVPGQKKLTVPNTPWERMYSTNDPSKNMDLTHGADFAPKRGRDRKTTYVKVNDLDH